MQKLDVQHVSEQQEFGKEQPLCLFSMWSIIFIRGTLTNMFAFCFASDIKHNYYMFGILYIEIRVFRIFGFGLRDWK